MTTNRLEAFSDGVLAIILTIMVLELKIPLGDDLNSLKPFIPKLLNYLLSFIFIGIYWNNHHHLFHAIEKIDGRTL
ncbi:TMEM175 family protein [Faecalibacter sp. LW9]|uniref:TMEM175 family protein n=1 Tax=Faecalibacter sp. LW9 TaxID=3103144 RepID=UPI002AFECC64|nr:TMEM175 family protein [Faecalibacter sp. LW9]